jgi:tetratricopeptide (TPR) repeat protein
MKKKPDNEWVVALINDGMPRELALKADEYDLLAMKQVAKIYYEKKNYERAVFWLEKIHYKEPHEYMALGKSYQHLGHPEWAKKCFDFEKWFLRQGRPEGPYGEYPQF